MTRVLSDDRLARRAAKGEDRAFATIFDRYHQRLYRYCLAIVGDPEDAQDALQNTMVKVLQGLPGEERRIELKPWLYRIAHNESIELLRRRRETRELDAEIAAAPGSGPAEEAASRERLRRLISDLEALPERQRGALVMRELSGLEFAEIGTALGTSPAVARQTLYEARLSLRQMDEGREMSCAAVMKALSDGDGRVSRRRDLRAHLRACASCRRFGEEITGRQRDLAGLAPLPAVAAAGLLQGVFGGGTGTGGGGLAAAVGGGAAKSAGASVALKGAATVAVVAAIGIGAADRGGLIDAGLPGGGSQAAKPAPPDSGSAGAAGDPANLPQVAGARSVARARARALGRTREVAAPGVREAGATAGVAASDGTGAAFAPTPAAPQSSVAHRHGKGHEKQLPSASAHGQQTATAHNGASHGPSAATRHPSHPAKPPHPAKSSHPAHPAAPSPEKAPPPPASSASPEKAQSHGNAAPEGAAAGPNTGKKP